ncbi:hypothetical protein F4861DRAFT_438964 [Xylaria intraflava]|nr:hypothetical protein F4861DRAFT_438964 [Xylaria intraflava]
MNSDDSDYVPRKCVTQWCRLCRFRLMKDDFIVIATEAGHTDRFCYRNLVDHRDPYLDLILLPCTLPCFHSHVMTDGMAASYHWSCFAETPFPPSLSLVKATEYSFEPLERTQRQREIAISRKIRDRLSSEYGTLPLEIWSMVAEYLISEYTIIADQECWLGRRSSSRRLDISKGISARYVYIDGVRYIADLSNTHEASDDRILEDKTEPTIDTVYALEDHLGLRQILFDTSGNPCDLSKYTRKPGMWWHTIKVTDGILQTTSDGLKLRKVAPSTEDERAWLTSWSTCWSTPIARADIRLLRFSSLISQGRPRVPLDIRMAALEINEPTITGYSACWTNHLVGLHAHYEGDLSFYRDYPTRHENTVWIYFPIHPGEFITEIWRRRHSRARDISFMLRTNTGRHATLGMYCTGYLPPWAQVATLTNSPTRVYFCNSTHGIAKLATKRQPINQASLPQERAPYQSPPQGTFFYSGASLADVVKIIPCRGKYGSGPRIIGLLIQYRNGDRTSVGQVRFDCLDTELIVENFPELCLWYRQTPSGNIYITRLARFPPGGDGPYRGLNLRWEGYLEWWFSHEECSIHYNPNPLLSA